MTRDKKLENDLSSTKLPLKPAPPMHLPEAVCWRCRAIVEPNGGDRTGRFDM
jgi:hypothetical protein